MIKSKSFTLFMSLVILHACGGPQGVEPTLTPGKATAREAILPTVSNREVYLRASFDDDPSSFIGRFIDDKLSVLEVDENKGTPKACSKHITYKEVKAGGTFSEYHQGSSSVEAKLGVKPIAVKGVPVEVGADVGVGNERHASIMVKYKMSRKLMGEIKDPEAYEECCKNRPGNCSGRYIGEFWGGSGEIYALAGRATDVDVKASVPTKGDLGVAVVDGWTWRKSTEFEDVYFAMRVYNADRGQDTCEWVDVLPTSDKGTYFVGMSQLSGTEDFARDNAMRHARQQVVKYLGEYISFSDASRGNSFQGYLRDDRMIETVSNGLVALVKDERYCKAELVRTPEGPMYKVKVLAFFPNEQRDAAARETVNTVKEELRRTNKLTAQEQQDLDALSKQLAEQEAQEQGGVE